MTKRAMLVRPPPSSSPRPYRRPLRDDLRLGLEHPHRGTRRWGSGPTSPGLNHFGQPANHIGPIALGLGGHMMNSMIIGIVFVALMRMLRNPAGALMFGTAYGVGLWALMRYVLLPLYTPNDRLFTTSMISPQWEWWVAHVALGMTAGLVYLLFGRRQLAAAGEGRLHELCEPRIHRAA